MDTEAYTMREAVEADYNNIIDFLHENFLFGEPINKAINLCEVGYRMPYFDRWIDAKLRQPGTVTFLAESPQADLLGVGFSIMHSKDAEGCCEPAPASAARCDQISDRFRRVLTFLSWLEEGAGLPPAIERAEFAMLSGRLDTRIPGLGTALAQKVVTTARERGVRVHAVTTTSAFSARIFEKLGFKEIFAVPFTDYKVDGKVVFATEAPHTHAKVLLLQETD